MQELLLSLLLNILVPLGLLVFLLALRRIGRNREIQHGPWRVTKRQGGLNEDALDRLDSWEEKLGGN
jgi:hypothetical protein